MRGVAMTLELALTEDPKRSRVGPALELAGMFLRRGDLYAARSVLREFKPELDFMLMREPRVKPEQEQEGPKP